MIEALTTRPGHTRDIIATAAQHRRNIHPQVWNSWQNNHSCSVPSWLGRISTVRASVNHQRSAMAESFASVYLRALAGHIDRAEIPLPLDQAASRSPGPAALGLHRRWHHRAGDARDHVAGDAGRIGRAAVEAKVQIIAAWCTNVAEPVSDRRGRQTRA